MGDSQGRSRSTSTGGRKGRSQSTGVGGRKGRGGGTRASRPCQRQALCSRAGCGQPVYDDEILCPSCKGGTRASPEQAATRQTGKRNADELSPQMATTHKKTRSDEVLECMRDDDVEMLLTDIDDLDAGTLATRLRDAVGRALGSAKENKQLREELQRIKTEFTEYKVAFAEKAFQMVSLQKHCIASPEMIQGEAQPATLELTLIEERENGTLDVRQIDRLLGSNDDGPVVETIKRKDNKAYLSFKDALERGKAKCILGTIQEGKETFTSIKEVAQNRLCPVIMRHVDITNLEDLSSELALRNAYITDTLRDVRIIYSCTTDPNVGHVKLLFSSRTSRELALARGRLFAWGKSHEAVEVLWDREVRRCYKCQRYGHVAKNCTTCGTA